ALAAISRLSTTEKGLTVAAVRQLYMSCVIPIADFGSDIWWKGQQGAADKLQKLQNKATRKILGAFRTTPVPLLDAEAALLPPSLRLTYAQRRMALRILTLDNHHPLTRRCPDSFHQMAEGVSQEELGGASWDEDENGQRKYPNSLVRILSTLKDWVKPASSMEVVNDDCGIKPAKIEFHISTSDKGTAAKEHNQLIRSLDDNNIMVYSDGSIIEVVVGAGVYLRGTSKWQEQRHRINLGTTMEVYDAELFGISTATSILVRLSQRHQFRHAWIFLENTAAIQRIQSLRPGPGQCHAIQAHTNAHTLSIRGATLHIAWVPGHEGVEGNEIADTLAKEGAKQPADDSQFNYVSYSNIRRLARAAAYSKWDELWEERRSGKSYRGHPKRKLEPVLKPLPKRDTARITHLRTGHGYFNEFLARVPTSNVDTP